MTLFVKMVLLLCILTPASRAGTPVFVKTGDDVLLNVTESEVPEKFIVLLWKFNTDDVLVSFSPGQDPNVQPKYSGRVELGVNKYSVKLKNLQKSDGGVYTGRLTTDEEIILAEYNVTVQDPVSPVRLVVDSVSSRSDSCNLTVTCSSEDSDSSSTFSCDALTCYQKGGNGSEITRSGASFHVYLSNTLIICNLSNQVSKAQTETSILHVCPRHVGSENLSGVSICLLKTVLFSVGLIVMVSAVISVHLMEKLNKEK